MREVALIVVGVLIALAVNAWWGERQDRSHERAYLLQLRQDVRENERILRSALVEDSASLGALVSLSAALRSGEPLSGSSTEALGVALRYSDPRPILGTLDHLIGSGRVDLIRADSVRLALIEYASLMHADLAEQSRHVDLLLAGMRDWLSRQQAAGLDCGMFVETEAAVTSTCDEEFRARWSILREDSQYRAAVLGVRIAAWNRVVYLERMLRETRRLRALLEHAAGRHGRDPGTER